MPTVAWRRILRVHIAELAANMANIEESMKEQSFLRFGFVVERRFLLVMN